MPSLKRLVRRVAALAAPPTCPACVAPTTRVGFCAACAADCLPSPRVGGVWAAWSYEGPVQQAILRWKEGGDEAAGAALVDVAVELALEAGVGREIEIVTVVPPAPLRTLRRGFHPPDAFASALAARLGAPLVARAVVRRGGRRQTGRTRAERHGAVAQRYRATARLLALAGKHVLLVDDIVTTGSTVGAVRALIQSVAPRSLRVAVIARVGTAT